MKKKLIAALLIMSAILTAGLFGCSGNNSGNAGNDTTSAVTEAETNRQYLSTDGEQIDIPNDGKTYIGYTVNSQAAGYIKGETIQSTDNKLKTVHAKANTGFRFVSWSDGFTSPDRLDSVTGRTENSTYTAIFDYDIREMPVFVINTETGRDVESKTEYINSDISLAGALNPVFNFDNLSAEIRGRGNNTWGYPKKSYKIKFTEKQNLLGLGKKSDRVWVLLANQCDQSLQRNHVSFETARLFDGIDFAPASVSVEVYLNGEYRGVYLLAEEIRSSSARVDVDDGGDELDIGYLVELSGYADENVFYAAGRKFQVHSDLSTDQKTLKRQIDYIAEYIDQCYDAVESGNREEIEKLMDIESYVDTYIVEELVKNLDAGWDSYYLFKDKGGKLNLGPLWDFDLALGNANEGEEFYDGMFTATTQGSGGGNPWYYTAMQHEWFRDLVRERWNEMKSQIDELPVMIRNEGASKLASYERNFEIWQIFGTTQNRETEFITSLKNYTEHYEYLAQWLTNRTAWLDEVINAEDFLTVRLGPSASSGESHTNIDYVDEATQKMLEDMEHAEITEVTSTSDGFDGEGIRNLFDDSQAKYCYSNPGVTDIIFTAKSPFTATHYVMMTANDTEGMPDRNPDSWKLYGSNDKNAEKNNAWELMDYEPDGSSILGATNFTFYSFEVSNPGEYLYYKLVLTDSFDIVQLGEMVLLG